MASPGSAAPASAGGSATPTPRPSCPASYLAPDPNRPEVTLTFRIGSDHRVVSGHERVRFTPDRSISELVFRLWPNGLEHRAGGSLTVTKALVGDRPVQRELASAGARSGTPGTLLTLPLDEPSAAGRPVTADLDFTLRLPPPFVDRLGSDGTTAWWGTGAPLLAWVRGTGWVREAGAAVLAESAVSEAAQTDVTVVAPTGDTVVANGTRVGGPARTSGKATWRFRSRAARDVVVAVGPFHETTAKVATPDGAVAVHVAVAPGLNLTAAEILMQLRGVFGLEVKHFGPYPFAELSIAALPGVDGTGIEYPGMFLLGDGGDPSIVAHELAHQWFYGLVGNDQDRHPWLDESLATAAEQIVDAEMFGQTAAPPFDADRLFADRRPVDSAASSFAATDQDGYTNVVYFKGSAALLLARQRAGAKPFDAALRCYLNANAWRVATPADFAAAFRHLPAVLTELRKTGAIR